MISASDLIASGYAGSQFVSFRVESGMLMSALPADAFCNTPCRTRRSRDGSRYVVRRAGYEPATVERGGGTPFSALDSIAGAWRGVSLPFRFSRVG